MAAASMGIIIKVIDRASPVLAQAAINLRRLIVFIWLREHRLPRGMADWIAYHLLPDIVFRRQQLAKDRLARSQLEMAI